MKRRDFSSRYGLTTLIGYYGGKVIDFVVKGSFCEACNLWSNKQGTSEYEEWLKGHEEECQINRVGSVGKMEVDAVQDMFSRSEDKFDVRY